MSVDLAEHQAWKKITPTKLVPAIRHIQDSFRSGARKCSEATWHLCHAGLHPQETNPTSLNAWLTAFTTYRTIVGPDARQMFDELLALGTPAAVLKAYLDIYRRGMEKNVREQFEETIQIGLANEKALTTHPADWSQTILRLLIDEDRYRVKLWIRKVCGEPECPEGAEASSVAWIQGQYWQAPRLILMEPSGHMAYSPSTAWTLEDVPHSQELLESFSTTFALLLGVYLKTVAGDACVRLAKIPTEPIRDLPERNAHVPTPRRRNVDERKKLIAELKFREPGVLARRICELIDKRIDRTSPALRFALAPLEPWKTKAPEERSWIDFYNRPDTHELVRSYVNKVPPLKTAKSPK